MPYMTSPNWKNHMIGDMLSYAYRDTVYTKSTYPSRLHYHDYYELVIFEQGDIRYVCESNVYYPKHGDIILIPAGKFHMSLINCERTHYKRHVFYLYPSAFDAIGQPVLTEFLGKHAEGGLLSLDSHEGRQKLLSLADDLRQVSDRLSTPLEQSLALSYILHIFYLFNQKSCLLKDERTTVPENVLALQQYINENYAKISSVSQVADHFFYSREYVSRLFKKHFDTTISDYITKRRIAQSQALIVQGVPMIDVANEVGFGSLSTFIRAFRTVTGMTPSEYRKVWRESF